MSSKKKDLGSVLNLLSNIIVFTLPNFPEIKQKPSSFLLPSEGPDILIRKHRLDLLQIRHNDRFGYTARLP